MWWERKSLARENRAKPFWVCLTELFCCLDNIGELALHPLEQPVAEEE